MQLAANHFMLAVDRCYHSKMARKATVSETGNEKARHHLRGSIGDQSARPAVPTDRPELLLGSTHDDTLGVYSPAGDCQIRATERAGTEPLGRLQISA